MPIKGFLQQIFELEDEALLMLTLSNFVLLLFYRQGINLLDQQLES